MGKTHLSGLDIGDVGTGIFGSVLAAQSVVITALAAPGAQLLHFPEPAIITRVFATDAAGVPVVATVSLGTTAGGTEVFTGATSASAETAVLKAVSGYVYAALSAGTVPIRLYITYVTRP